MRQLAPHALALNVGSVCLGNDLPRQVFDRHAPRLRFTSNATVRGQRAEDNPRFDFLHGIVDQLAPIAVIGIVTGINCRMKVLGFTSNPTLPRVVALDGEITEPVDLARLGVRLGVRIDLFNRAVRVLNIPLLCHAIFTDQEPDPANWPYVPVLDELIAAIRRKS